MANNLKQIDAGQVLRSCYDPVTNRLRTDALVVASIGGLEVAITHVDDSIRIGDGTDLVTVTNIGADYGLDVNIINAPEIVIDHADDSIRLGDGTDLITSTPSAIGSFQGLDTNDISGFGIEPFDYTALTTTATTDTWTFRNGGSGGTIVTVITITYTDSTKSIIDNVERTT